MKYRFGVMYRNADKSEIRIAYVNDVETEEEAVKIVKEKKGDDIEIVVTTNVSL